MYMIEKNQTPMLSSGLGIPPDAIRSCKGSSISPLATPGCTPHHIFASPVSYVPSHMSRLKLIPIRDSAVLLHQ